MGADIKKFPKIAGAKYPNFQNVEIHDISIEIELVHFLRILPSSKNY